jgi:malate permease and related proteins
MTYWQLLSLTLPVFALIGVGAVTRRIEWVKDEAEASLVRLVVNLMMPCLIFDSIIGNPAMRQSSNIVWPPLAGFFFTAIGFILALYLARAIRLRDPQTQRTFALSAGIANYGYLPLPIMAQMFGPDSQGILMVHNVGVEAALWTVGIVILSGTSMREAGRKLLNPVVISLCLAVTLNVSGLSEHVPSLVTGITRTLGKCAIPVGLLTTGSNLAQYLNQPRNLLNVRVGLGASVLRLAILPVLMLVGARFMPISIELQRVLVIQAAMPAAAVPILLARHYGGVSLTAVQIVLGTTAVSVLTCPLWIRAGMAFVGL